MSDQGSLWPCARTIHLFGGGRAIVEYGPEVKIFPPVEGKGPLSFYTTGFGGVLTTLKGVGLMPIAVENRYPGERGKEMHPSDQRVYFLVGQSWQSICRDQGDLWDQVAHSAYGEKKLVLWDLARRIGHQLDVCEWRFLQISNAYRDQLGAVVARKRRFELGDRFEDGHTWRAYLAVQSFLVDCCILRDYFAEFIAKCIVQWPKATAPEVDSMAGLLRQIPNAVAFEDPVLTSLKAATREGGWMQVLGAYRDLVVHCAPLASSGDRLLASLVEVPVTSHRPLRFVSLPLPADPGSIRVARKGENRAEHLSDALDRLYRGSADRGSSKDALVYCHAVLCCVGLFSRDLIKKSPVSPRTPEINISHIRSFSSVNE